MIEVVQIDLQILKDSKLSPFPIDPKFSIVCIRVPLLSHLSLGKSLYPDAGLPFV